MLTIIFKIWLLGALKMHHWSYFKKFSGGPKTPPQWSPSPPPLTNRQLRPCFEVSIKIFASVTKIWPTLYIYQIHNSVLTSTTCKAEILNAEHLFSSTLPSLPTSNSRQVFPVTLMMNGTISLCLPSGFVY